ncbi:MAG: RdgB/HAM1 family non-canonical purine NTP pyrophosphatase [Elusimicrobia bacterium]|nr:RdgB/HAM1 family non-canonical purine NTP pyrophosphatase [Elusimicrobiota bacterium]
MKLVLATHNPHKTAEISAMLKGAGLDLDLRSLAEFPQAPEVAEDGLTLEENARKKALAAARATGLRALADDSGLEVERLGGAPGVLSARYAGPGCDYAANNAKLLRELEGVPPEGRKAAFRCIIAFADGEDVLLFEGRLDGVIAERPSGTNGFGYDPVFFIPERGRTLAELAPDEKNRISHRGRALAAAARHLRLSAACLLLLAALCAPSPCRAEKTQEGQTTYWDMLMQAQAARDLMQGSRDMEGKRYDDAVREFSKAVVRNPGDALSHRMLGVAYYWSGRVDLAEAEFNESIKIEPDNAQAHLLLGIVYAWRGNTAKAYGEFKLAEKNDPRRADIQMNLGSLEDGDGKYVEALDHFRKAAAYDPDHPLYRFQVGSLYRKLGRDEEAVEALKAAVSRYQSYQEALLELGSIYERMGRMKDAADMFRKAVRLKEKDSVARYRLARAYLLDKRFDKTRESLAGVFHLTPEGRGGGLALSVSYGGRSKEGEEKPEEPSESPPLAEGSSGPLEILSRNLLRLPLDRDAALGVDMVFVPKPKLVKSPGRTDGPSSLKQALERAGGGPQAQTIASRREFSLRVCDAAAREADVRAVIADLREALAKAPKDAEVRLGMNLSFSEGPAQRASAADEKSRVSFQPHDVGNDLGLWVIGTGWMSIVEEALPRPEDPPPSSSLGWLVQGIGYTTLGNSSQAEVCFIRAIDLEPREALAHLGLGVAKVIRGDEAGAAASYRKALEIDPKNRAAAEGLKWLERPLAGGSR